MVPLSTKPAKRAEAPFMAALAVFSYCVAACWALPAASLAVAAAELAAFLASVAVLAAALAVWAAVLAACAAELAAAAASVAGFWSSVIGTLTSSSPFTPGREFTPFSEDTVSSSCTPWLSALMALSTCCMSSCDMAILLHFILVKLLSCLQIIRIGLVGVGLPFEAG